MGLYGRPDSDFWWYRIEGANVRRSTGVPRAGGNAKADLELRRRAELIYADAQSKHALAAAGLVKPEKPIIGFTKFAGWFEIHVLAHQRGKERAVSMLRQLTLHFGRITDLRQITDAVVREWMTARKAQVSPATVNREYDVLRTLLRAAVPAYLDAYPLAEVKRLRVVEREARVLTYDEEKRLLDVAGAGDRAFLLAGLDTLLRLGSLLSLKWEQVKLEQRVIVPLNAKASTGPKPITTRLYRALKDLPRTSPYVFQHFRIKGNGPTAAKNIATRRFNALCQLANVPHGRIVNGVTIHCLRHTGASRALANGASVRTVMELGGWTMMATVLRYVHATDQDVQAAAESIGQSRDGAVIRNARNRR